MNKCEYCTETDKYETLVSDNSRKVFGTEIPLVMGISGYKIEVIAGDETILEKKINFCPMCGRKLSEED